KTVEAAKELALDRLGVVEDELEYEVIDEPRTGFLRRSDARIRARVLPLSREKPSDRRRRRGAERSSGRTTSAGPERSATRTEERKTSPDEAGGSSASNRSRSRRRRGGRGGAQKRPAPNPNGKTEDENQEAEVDVETMPISEQAEFAATFVDELVRAMG